ncbi:MAG: hypothetical protein EHM70_25710, partial [Chloroflexota bacterium]
MNPVDKILASEVITAVRAAAPQGQPVYLVGGAVRDALLGLPPHDLDFCLSEKVKLTARKIAELLGAAFYPLNEERSNYRLIHKDSQGRRYAIDFAAIRGTDIEADLHARDFTINAMAMNVIES